MACLYMVYSAKVAAERNPQVGPTTAFEVLWKHQRWELSHTCFKYLNGKVRKYKVPRLEFKEEYLELITDEEG